MGGDWSAGKGDWSAGKSDWSASKGDWAAIMADCKGKVKGGSKGTGIYQGSGIYSAQDGRHHTPAFLAHAKNVEKLKSIAADCKTWVNGLAKEVSCVQLEKHFQDLGCPPSVTEVSLKGG